MPQMSPLFWSLLFVTFSLLFVFSMVKIYFSATKSLTSQKSETASSSKHLTWVW